MKNGNEKIINQERAEETALNNIKKLYHEMLQSVSSNQEYRDKISAELLELQQEDGTWRVIENIHFPTDIRVEYVLIPTYYATAALMAYMNKGGELNEKEKDCLKIGLHAAVERKLNGSGYESTSYKLKALAVYKAAGLYEWMNRFGDQSPEFSDMVRDIIGGFQIGLMTGRTYSDWNVNFEKDFRKEVSDYEEALIPWVWYAAYGSNLSKERFMRYIERCTDQSKPEDDRRFEFPYDITFAGTAVSWGNKGKAFLDDSKEGKALGRIYKVSRSQFEEIQNMEGPDYTKKIHLGWEEGIPVYTFTAEEITNENNSPSADYIEVILQGLRETYPEKSDLALQVYLFSHNVMTGEDKSILSFIRNNAHGVSIQQIVDEPGHPCLTNVRKSIKKLLSWQLIKQDSRNRRAGARTQDRDAVFYTKKENRDLIDVLLIIVR